MFEEMDELYKSKEEKTTLSWGEFFKRIEETSPYGEYLLDTERISSEFNHVSHFKYIYDIIDEVNGVRRINPKGGVGLVRG